MPRLDAVAGRGIAAENGRSRLGAALPHRRHGLDQMMQHVEGIVDVLWTAAPSIGFSNLGADQIAHLDTFCHWA